MSDVLVVKIANQHGRVVHAWWTEDRKWFCLRVADGGGGEATVSLTPDEASTLVGALMGEAR